MKTLILLLLFASYSHAESAYIGMGYGKVGDYEMSTLIIGGQFNEIFGVEGRAAIQGDIDSLYGAYGIVALPFDSFHPYLILGHTRSRIDDDNKDSTSKGVGLRYVLREAWRVQIEYMQVGRDLETYGVNFQLVF